MARARTLLADGELHRAAIGGCIDRPVMTRISAGRAIDRVSVDGLPGSGAAALPARAGMPAAVATKARAASRPGAAVR